MVIVEYRDPALTEACVASLARGTFRDFAVLLVDNTPAASRAPPAPEVLAARFRNADGGWTPPVECLSAGVNLGFCAGCNLGIRRAADAGAEYVLILNYDTLAAPDFLERLVARADTLPDLGVLGAKIRYQEPADRLWYAGGRLSLAQGVGKHAGYNEADAGQHDAFRKVTYVTGCCMLVPVRVFRRVGSFHEGIFMYLDDAEFCLRLRGAGLGLYYEPTAALAHRVGPGTRKEAFPDYYLYFSVRNKPCISRDPAYRLYLHLFTVALAAAKLGYYALHPGVSGRGGKARAIALGLWDSFSAERREARRFPRLFTAGTPE